MSTLAVFDTKRLPAFFSATLATSLLNLNAISMQKGENKPPELYAT